MNVLKQAMVVSILCSFFQQIRCLDNGLAITPPSKYSAQQSNNGEMIHLCFTGLKLNLISPPLSI